MSNTRTKRSAQGGGTIRKRSDGRWEARYTTGFDPVTGKQVQKSVYGKTQKEVQQKLMEILKDLADGSYVAPNHTKLGDWLDTWLRDYTGNIKPATYSAYEQHVRVHLKPYLGQITLSNLTLQAIQQTYNLLAREKGISPKSLKNIHGVLHRSLNQAVRLGLLHSNPADGAVLPRIEKKPLCVMNDEDLCRFLEAIQGDFYEIPLYVTVFTGLRQGEVLGLTWDCVDFEKNTLLINKQHNKTKGDSEHKFSSLKNDTARKLTVAQEVMDALKRQKALQETWAKAAGELWENDKNLVFTTQTGRYINNRTLYANFKRIAGSIGLGELRFHDLRHRYAVTSLRAGDDIKTLQENLGHATASFTLSTYAHATELMKHESARRMESFIRGLQDSVSVS